MALERIQSDAILNSKLKIMNLELQLAAEIRHLSMLKGEPIPVKRVLTIRPLESVFERAKRRADGIPDSDAIKRGLELL